MTYGGYASYAAGGGYGDVAYGNGYGYEPDGQGGPGAVNALNDLAGPNSSAYEQSYSPTAGVQTSYATEDAGGNVYYRNTSYTGNGYYTYHSGSFSSSGGYYGSNFYGSRYNYISDTDEPHSGTGGYDNYQAGDQAPPLYAHSLLDGPESSSYATATSSQFGTVTADAYENTNGGVYQHVTLSYGSADFAHYYTDSSYNSATGNMHSDLSTYLQSGPSYHGYNHSYTTSEYTSKYHSTTTDGSYSIHQYNIYSVGSYQNGSSTASVSYFSGTYEGGIETGSSSYHHSIYTNPYGVSYQNGYYGSP